MNRTRFRFVAGAIAVAPGSLLAQTAPLATRDILVQAHSGPVVNPGGGDERAASRVYSTQVHVPEAPWVRLKFDQLVLAGDPAAGSGSYVLLTSVRDGGVQVLDSRHQDDWANTSAYFNGDTVTVELYAYPGTGVNHLSMTRAWAGTGAGGVGPVDSICGPTDDRVLSSDPRQARLMPVGCTAWMIDNGDCANRFLTAGHCINNGSIGNVVQFNVPLSTSTGTPVHPPPQDQFPVRAASIQSTGNAGVGVEAAQFFTGANSTTGLHARVHMGGGAYTLASNAGTAGGQLRVTGYGTTTGGAGGLPLNQSQVQKTHTGAYTAHTGSTIQYTVDTLGGNSGSPVVNLATGQAIGIHTHGGCTGTGGENNGTAIEGFFVQAFLNEPIGPCAPMAPIGTAGRGPLGEGGVADHFNRADGPIGGAWSGAGLAGFSVNGNRGAHTGGPGFIQNDAYEGDGTCVHWVDVILDSIDTQFVALAGGLGGSDFYYVTAEALTGNGNFTHVGFYRGSTGAAWPGGAGLIALGAPNEFNAARLRVSVSGDVVTLDIQPFHGIFGIPNQTYSSPGLSSISGSFGKKFGIGASGAARFDNWNATHQGATDGFNRANGAVSGLWAPWAGTFVNFSISGNSVTHAGAASDIMGFTGALGHYTSMTQWVDVRGGAAAPMFVALCAGLGGTDNLFVKLQGAGNFSHIGFFHGNNAAGWPGQTGGVPFFNLNSNVPSARLRLSVSADGDTATLDIDTDFDGVPNESHSRGGLNNISGSFGTGFGIAAAGDPTFDNYAILQTGTDTFSRPNGPIGGAWVAGTGPLANFGILNGQARYAGGAAHGSITSILSAAVTDHAQWVDAILEPGGGPAYVALLSGLGGTDNLFIKLENTGGPPDFDRVFFHHGPTGGSGWPGMAPAAAFDDLAMPTPGARLRALIGPDGDTVTVQIDNNFDGLPDESFSRTGLAGITHTFGRRLGLGASGPVSLDNWSATPVRGACYPDCNADGALNLADFGCFQTRFALADLYADCNQDAVLNLADFGCFQTQFALGCP